NESREERVHDSTADMRYLVLPLQPKGTEDYTEAHLVDMIGRDALIGVVEVAAPSV
ncbi:MAG: nitrile hydratase subunit alpha, partial [Rhodospirillaceae bacterium]|nr:nitrile hydratase subunit alpha [Rhodospirillaceae bacterium]